MRKVLVVVGEFLGHWGRSLLVADALRQYKSVEIVFAGRDPAGNLRSLAQQYSFRMISLGSDQNKDLLVFADRLEAIMHQEQPDLIILDIGLIPWAIYVRFPGIPIAAISHYFLTPLCPEITLQRSNFARNRNQWNQARSARGLDPLGSADEIFENCLVLLADPDAIVPRCEKMPDNYKVVGALVWEPPVDLPPELEDAENLLYVSIGSSGEEMPCSILEALMEALNAPQVIIAHPAPAAFSGIRHHAFKKYNWLPGEKVLSRSRFAVTQGGAGSTYQALQAGVPVACWPFHRNHVILSRHLEATGAGLLIDKSEWINQVEFIGQRYQDMTDSVRKLEVDDTSSAVQKVINALDAIS